MRNIIKRFLVTLNFWRVFPIWLMIICSSSKTRKDILLEIRYWEKCLKMSEKSDFFLLGRLLIEYREYRNLIQHRLRWLPSGGYLKFFTAKVLFSPMETLYLSTREIGVPIYIQHGFSTVIAAKEVGSYCWINQQVTIGWTFDDEPPRIGNGVRITAGAKVLGKIKIGDNAIVGANAVVVKSVDDNSIVGGVPAKKIGINEEHKLYI